VDSARRSIIDQLKAAYFHLAYLQETLGILERNDEVLRDVQKITESRYSVGQGNQQEVLKAQLQHTKILQEITMHHREVGQMQAQLKQLLNRNQESPDIQTLPLALRPIPYTASQLMELAKQENPDIQAQQQMVKQSDSQVELSRKEFRLTSMCSICGSTRMEIPATTIWRHSELIYRTEDDAKPNWHKRKPTGSRPSGCSKQNSNAGWRKCKTSLWWRRPPRNNSRFNNEGLIPQSEATFRSAQAAYQSGKQDFETMLNSFLDVLSMQIEYQRELADHETAVARLERLRE